MQSVEFKKNWREPIDAMSATEYEAGKVYTVTNRTAKDAHAAGVLAGPPPLDKEEK